MAQFGESFFTLRDIGLGKHLKKRDSQFKPSGNMVQCTLPDCGKRISYGATIGHKRRGCEASREPHQKTQHA